MFAEEARVDLDTQVKTSEGLDRSAGLLLVFAAAVAAFSAATSRWLPAGRLCAASAAITLFSGRMVWSSGARQLTFGLVAAALTYGVGAAIGVTVAG